MCDFELLCEKDGMEYLLYRPDIFHLYAKCYFGEERPPYFSRLIHTVRMTRELLFAHYVVVYLRKNKKIVGHLVVSRGGTRIAVSTEKDIVIGPVWVIPSERGNGIASRAIDCVLHSLKFSYRYAYEYIEYDNIASIRTVEKNRFSLVAHCSEFGLLKTIREADGGKLLVYRFEKENNG